MEIVILPLGSLLFVLWTKTHTVCKVFNTVYTKYNAFKLVKMAEKDTRFKGSRPSALSSGIENP